MSLHLKATVLQFFFLKKKKKKSFQTWIFFISFASALKIAQFRACNKMLKILLRHVQLNFKEFEKPES